MSESDTKSPNNTNNTTTITFAEQSVTTTTRRPQDEKIKQNPLTRSSTGQSTSSFDVRSVRSALMNKMNLVKRRQRKRAEQLEKVETPPYHTMDLETVATLLKSDLVDGLSEKEVESRRLESGYNEMEGEGGVNPVKLLLKQFFNIMVLILLVAMVRHCIYFFSKNDTMAHFHCFRLYPLYSKIGSKLVLLVSLCF